MPEPIPTLYSLGAAPLSSGFLSNLLDTICLLVKHIIARYFFLHNRPNFDQQLVLQADHEHFYILSADTCYYDETRLEHG